MVWRVDSILCFLVFVDSRRQCNLLDKEPGSCLVRVCLFVPISCKVVIIGIKVVVNLPISKEDFNNWFTIKQSILTFLKKNKDLAFRPREIAKALNINPSSATAFMGKLTKEKLVIRKSPYYLYNGKVRK